MKRNGAMSRRWLGALAVLAMLLAAMATKAASFLVVDEPRRSDVIVVLAGETDRRPARALELLQQGYGRRIVLDVQTTIKIYEFSQIQLAEKYVQDLPQRGVVSICPIYGLSTKDESKDVEKCLAHEGARSVLLVTSDYHTRRARSVFRRELPGLDFSIAAARNEEQFGARWWTHRQWAKTLLYEWLRLIWWNVVDEWH